jgi:hypothetical protein
MGDMKTTFENMCAILADFEKEYIEDSRFEDFISVRNLGFPLAIAYVGDMVNGFTEEGKKWVTLSFSDLLEKLGLQDIGWTDLFDIERASNLEPEKE